MMMTSVSAIMAMRGRRWRVKAVRGALALMVAAAGVIAVWYRQAYNV